MTFKKTIIVSGITLLIGAISVLYIPALNKGVYHMLVDSILEESVPFVYSKDIDVTNDVILDTRSQEEYTVSHIPNAIWVGEESIELPKVEKEANIIVYCSLGKRSEVQGEKLTARGYSNVHNLYGGIIEWHNDGMTTIDSSEEPTETIHPYSWFWGLWIL